MNTLHQVLTLVLISFINMGMVSAATKEKPFDSFHAVRTRNIFDPNRQPGRTATGSKDAADFSDIMTLTGTLIQENKAFAFFSSPKFSKVVALQGQISGCKVTGISRSTIDLEKNDQKISVPVGKQIRMPEAGPLEIVENLDSGSAPTAADSATKVSQSTQSSVEPASAGSTDTSDVIRKMMEKRQKELSK